MADLKITELTENTTPASTDITVMVDDPAGTPATQKVTLANLASLVLSHLKATGANVTTGTSDITIVTPKAMGDADVNTRLKSKTIQITRDGTAATADVSYTGIGFTPTSIVCVMSVNGTSYWSSGNTDSAKLSNCIYGSGAGNVYGSVGYLIQYSNQSGFAQNAVVKTYDADGFTLTYTKIGSPTANTMLIYIICYR